MSATSEGDVLKRTILAISSLLVFTLSGCSLLSAEAPRELTVVDVQDFEKRVEGAGFTVIPRPETESIDTEDVKRKPRAYIDVVNPLKGKVTFRALNPGELHMEILVRTGANSNCIYELVSRGDGLWTIDEYIDKQNNEVGIKGLPVVNPTAAEITEVRNNPSNKGKFNC